jgi:hypothetical protein
MKLKSLRQTSKVYKAMSAHFYVAMEKGKFWSRHNKETIVTKWQRSLFHMANGGMY